MPEAIHYICLFHGTGFGELVGENVPNHGEALSNLVESVLTDASTNVQCTPEDVYSHGHILTLEGMADVVDIVTTLM